MPSARTTTVDRARQEWGWLLLLLLLVGATVGWLRWDAYRNTLESERQRLGSQAAAMEANLARQLQGAYRAMLSVRADLPQWRPEDRSAAVSLRLTALVDAMPGVRTMILFDADGLAVASNRTELIGRNFGQRDYFQPVKTQADPAALYLSPPFRTVLGAYAMNLALAVTAPDGRFEGAVTVTLDPTYFEVLLRTSRYAPDVRAAVAHGDGGVLIVDPPVAALEGANMARADSLFSHHVASGQAGTLQEGPSAGTGDVRMMAMRSLKAETLPLDKPMVLALSRSRDALLAGWRHESAVAAGLYALLAVGAALALALLQRRQRAFEALTLERAAQARVEAERLRLALGGGDLALWDLDVPRGHATVNERWATMLGYQPDDPEGGSDRWPQLMHPDDRERVTALQQAHLDGRSDSFEASYRLRHHDGHWVWVLDRGRVVDRDAAGRALRMVGTHMDITSRVQAEDALRRSEQSLAVTLQSIGDAVIATDVEGRITRINDAARRLTAWPGEDAIGRPLSDVFRIFDAETRKPGLDPVARVLASGEVVALANGTVLAARDGSEHQIADSAAPIRTEDGTVLGVVLVFSDVTEQYRMVQALRRSGQKSLALLAALRSGVVVHAPDTQVLDANPSACRILGLSLDQMRGKVAIDTTWAFLEEDGTPMAIARYPVNQVLAGADLVRNLVVGLRRPDLPVPVWALCTAFALRDDAGVLQEVVVTFYDITERKQAEEALQRSAGRLRLAGRLARLGGWSLDLASGRVELSADAAAVMGTPTLPAQLHLADILALVLPAHRSGLEAALQRADVFDIEVGAVMPNGRALTLRLMGEPVRDELGRRVAMQGAMQDVTESRREQQQLLLLQTAVAQLDDIVLITAAEPLDEPGPPIVFVNAAFERVTGWRSDEVLGRSPRLLQCAATDRGELDRVRQALQRHEPVHAELLNVARDGRTYWVDVQIAPLTDADGRVTHMVAVERDISERKRAEAQARETQEALAATLEAVPDLLFELDIEGRVRLYHSPRSDLLYVPPEVFLGKRVYDFLPTEAADTIAKAVVEAHEQGYSGGGQYALMLNGSEHWFELSVSRKATAPGDLPRVIALARDITERKQGEAQRVALERQLRDAHKIESIGTLTGGIAHDFNNILPAILGNVALARQDLPADHPALQSLEQIQRAGLRARTLVQQILTFSRRQPQALVAQPLQPVLLETLSLLRATLPAAVRLETAISDDPVPVELDATQLQQVLMNLCTNAWHALPDGRGRIEVGLAVADAATAARLGGGDLPAGPAMHLWVSDNGSGMDTETRERCFDPFFTTKPVGQGTGLGLSVVHGIVRGHHGSITVHSSPGAGSSFHVLLPRARRTPAQPDALDAQAASTAQGLGERIWYVDDDPVMLLMVERLLERLGYRVTVCDSAVQALARAQDGVRLGEAPPDLVVTDYNMPDVSGIELAAQLGRLWPQVPVVLSSGYIADTLHAQAAQAGVRALLHKEQTLEELPALVRRLLGAGAAPR